MLGYESASPTAVTICSLVWGAIMLLTACLGFKGLKWLNYIAVPALVVVCLYGIIASMVQNDGVAMLTAYNPPVSQRAGVRDEHGGGVLCTGRADLR